LGSYVIQYCINQAFSVFNIFNTAILILQVLSKDDPSRKTYVYKLNVPVAAQWISLAVAPFEILPDHQFNLISHMCLPANMLKLRNTVEFFHNAFRFFILVMWLVLVWFQDVIFFPFLLYLDITLYFF